jgi:tRNA1(Val) A37 N6-methylase TrmN6
VLPVLAAIEQTRIEVSKGTDAKRKSLLGQFLTPASTARFMAGLFSPATGDSCSLLDPGAGIGSLERCIHGDMRFDQIEVTAFEFDSLLMDELGRTLKSYSQRLQVVTKIVCGDFIEAAVNQIQFPIGTRFTHAILNPPYKKIGSDSRYRLLLRAAGIETVNMYSAFVALALSLLTPGGQLVAIVPRSFCNGPYYRSFRRFLLERAAILQMHLFTSRSAAFKDDNVLQENLILLLERDGRQREVVVSTSTDDNFSDLIAHSYPMERIVFPDDPESFIHVPSSPDLTGVESLPAILHSLDDLGIKVSTGPVVDFRLKDHLSEMPQSGTVPLLYPNHFTAHTTVWPQATAKKPNAIHCNAATDKWLYPTGFYCVVRRFSSKEEKRRIVANVVEPHTFPDALRLGFENHLNVFHENKQGLPVALAHGLTVFLNTTAVDDQFRRFNGHTQVNATDLRTMKYPSRDALVSLGKWAMNNQELTQKAIDEKLRDLLA